MKSKFNILNTPKYDKHANMLSVALDYIYLLDSDFKELIDGITKDIPITISLMGKYNIHPVFGKTFDEFNLCVINMKMFSNNYTYYDELLLFVVLHEIAHMLQVDYDSNKKYYEDEADTFSMNLMDKYCTHLGLNKMNYNKKKLHDNISIKNPKIYDRDKLNKDIDYFMLEPILVVNISSENFYIRNNKEVYFHNIILFRLFEYISRKSINWVKVNEYRYKSDVNKKKKLVYCEKLTRDMFLEIKRY